MFFIYLKTSTAHKAKHVPTIKYDEPHADIGHLRRRFSGRSRITFGIFTKHTSQRSPKVGITYHLFLSLANGLGAQALK